MEFLSSIKAYFNQLENNFPFTSQIKRKTTKHSRNILYMTNKATRYHSKFIRCDYGSREKSNSSEIYQSPFKKYLFSAQRTQISLFSFEYPRGVLKCQSSWERKIKKSISLSGGRFVKAFVRNYQWNFVKWNVKMDRKIRIYHKISKNEHFKVRMTFIVIL